MEEISKRLKQARTNAGYSSATSAAERCGVAYSTYAGHENGTRGVTRDAAVTYARAFGVSPDWILFGGGEAPERVDLDQEAKPGQSLVPVFDVAASAGHGAFVDYEAQAYSLAFPPNYLNRLTSSSTKNLAIISVKGDSMEPTLLDDDIVLLDTSKINLNFDGMFVLSFDGVLQVKRVGRSAKPGFVTVISDNTSFPPYEAAATDIRAVGKVLWYGRKV